MKKIKIILFTFFLLLIPMTVFAQTYPFVDNVEPDKAWTFEFKDVLDPSTFNGITVTNGSGVVVPIKVQLTSDCKGIIITPQKSYQLNETYTLTIKNLECLVPTENVLIEPITQQFKIKHTNVTLQNMSDDIEDYYSRCFINDKGDTINSRRCYITNDWLDSSNNNIFINLYMNTDDLNTFLNINNIDSETHEKIEKWAEYIFAKADYFFPDKIINVSLNYEDDYSIKNNTSKYNILFLTNVEYPLGSNKYDCKWSLNQLFN